MAGAIITATFDSAAMQGVLQRMTAFSLRTQPLMRLLGVQMREMIQTRIEQGVTPSGEPFAPLNPLYASGKRGPGILRGAGMRGGLEGSLTLDATATTTIVGTNKVYGAIQQFGGVIKPKSGGLLVFRMGGRTIKASSVTIPARPYLGLSAGDEAELVAEAVDYVARQVLRI